MYNPCLTVLSYHKACLTSLSLTKLYTGSCLVQPQSPTGGYWEQTHTTTVFYWFYSELPSAASLLLVDTGSIPVQPQSSTEGEVTAIMEIVIFSQLVWESNQSPV